MAKRKTTPDIMGLLGGEKEEVSVKKKAPAKTKKAAPVKQSKSSKQDKPTVKKGLPDELTRATFIMREDQLESLKALAYFERKNIKDVMEDALERYLNRRVTEEVMEVYSRK